MAVSRRSGTSFTKALVLGGLAVGVFDLLDAFVFFGLRGATLTRIPQSIAAGLIGRDAFTGGIPTMALGVLLHFTIAFTIVGVYLVLSRVVPVLASRPLVCGPLYGLVVWAVMNLVVVPYSANGSGRFPWPIAVNAVLINAWLIHIFGVGIPSALAARTARR